MLILKPFFSSTTYEPKTAKRKNYNELTAKLNEMKEHDRLVLQLNVPKAVLLSQGLTMTDELSHAAIICPFHRLYLKDGHTDMTNDL